MSGWSIDQLRERRVRRRWQVRTEWENIVPADPVSSRELKLLRVTAQRPLRFVSTVVLGTALICVALLVVTSALGISDDGLFIVRAHAQAKPPEPIEKAKKAVETLINRLRGRDMPEGIVKTNGRIEATRGRCGGEIPGSAGDADRGRGRRGHGRTGRRHHLVAGNRSPAARRAGAGAESQAGIGGSDCAHRPAQQRFGHSPRTDYERGKTLLQKGDIAQQVVDQRRNKFEAAEAAYVAANAQRDQAESAIKAAEADVERLQSILVDLVLVSPRSGRVQYRLARAGEVVAAGQRVLTILDLNDVYMTIYLPADQAGQLTLGDEARTILDPVPQYVLPATISFVATEAQFTPKSVETAEEREKLMFRVKLQGDPQVLDQVPSSHVKTGVRGLGFVRTDPKIAWPAELEVKLPQ